MKNGLDSDAKWSRANGHIVEHILQSNLRDAFGYYGRVIIMLRPKAAAGIGLDILLPVPVPLACRRLIAKKSEALLPEQMKRLGVRTRFKIQFPYIPIS